MKEEIIRFAKVFSQNLVVWVAALLIVLFIFTSDEQVIDTRAFFVRAFLFVSALVLFWEVRKLIIKKTSPLQNGLQDHVVDNINHDNVIPLAPTDIMMKSFWVAVCGLLMACITGFIGAVIIASLFFPLFILDSGDQSLFDFLLRFIPGGSYTFGAVIVVLFFVYTRWWVKYFARRFGVEMQNTTKRIQPYDAFLVVIVIVTVGAVFYFTSWKPHVDDATRRTSIAREEAERAAEPSISALDDNYSTYKRGTYLWMVKVNGGEKGVTVRSLDICLANLSARWDNLTLAAIRDQDLLAVRMRPQPIEYLTKTRLPFEVPIVVGSHNFYIFKIRVDTIEGEPYPKFGLHICGWDIDPVKNPRYPLEVIGPYLELTQ